MINAQTVELAVAHVWLAPQKPPTHLFKHRFFGQRPNRSAGRDLFMNENPFNAAILGQSWPDGDSMLIRARIGASIVECLDALIATATSRTDRRKMNATGDLARYKERRAHFLACLSSMTLPFQEAVKIERARASSQGKMDFDQSPAHNRAACLRWVAELILEGGSIAMNEDQLLFRGDPRAIMASAFNVSLELENDVPHRPRIGLVVETLKEIGLAVTKLDRSIDLKDEVDTFISSSELLAAAKFVPREFLARSRIADPTLYSQMLLQDLHDRIAAFVLSDGDLETASSVPITNVPLPDVLLAELRIILAEVH